MIHILKMDKCWNISAKWIKDETYQQSWRKSFTSLSSSIEHIRTSYSHEVFLCFRIFIYNYKGELSREQYTVLPGRGDWPLTNLICIGSTYEPQPFKMSLQLLPLFWKNLVIKYEVFSCIYTYNWKTFPASSVSWWWD